MLRPRQIYQTEIKYTKLKFRFDFDTQEEYANYKSQQEAMPKVRV